MAVGIGRRVESYECTTVEVEKLKRGDRIVEDGRLVGVIAERVHEPFGGCRHNVHVKVDCGLGREQPVIKTWCYIGGTQASVIAY